MFSVKTKRIIAVICLFAFVLSFVACTVVEDKVVASLGKYEKREFYTSGGFQDFTDYAKYSYTSANIAENKYLKRIRETDLETINIHLDDFEGWLEVIKKNDALREVVVNYDFDRTIIDTEDYYYIDSLGYTENDGHISFVRYNIYLYDTQTQVLFYFHNNI